jgi:hypothetical protein
MSQFTKLLYNKKIVDTPTGAIAEWRLSPWKLFFLLLGTAICLTVLYAFLFAEDTYTFLGTLVFYSIVLLVALAVTYITANSAIKAKSRIQGFLIAFILIIVVYWALGSLLGYFKIMEFHMGGYALWLIITSLAYMGAKRLDGNLDRNDIGFALLVLIVLLGANVPITENGGFLASLDALIRNIFSFIP